MRLLIQKLLREGLEDKSVSKVYMKGLLNNVTDRLAQKYLKAWLNRGEDKMVVLSPKEHNILKLIQRGGILPSQFHSKN